VDFADFGVIAVKLRPSLPPHDDFGVIRAVSSSCNDFFLMLDLFVTLPSNASGRSLFSDFSEGVLPIRSSGSRSFTDGLFFIDGRLAIINGWSVTR
jgi:hypothetical protein